MAKCGASISQQEAQPLLSFETSAMAYDSVKKGEPPQVSFLSWDNLNVFVEEKQLLSNVSGHASPGRLLAVMGASGAGKSTFLSALAGLLGPKVNNFIQCVVYLPGIQCLLER